jgi:Cyclin
MVDWTVSVHEQLQLVAEILHLTVAITDSYLQVDP